MRQLVLDKIDEILDYYGSKPQCYLVATVLAGNFGGMIWYNNDHCITQIGEDFYDKKGVYPVERLARDMYIPLHQYGMDIENTLIKAAQKSLSL
jgi:hypothetical protein